MAIGHTALQEVEEVRRVLWGNNVSNEVFLHWSQGFDFSEDEPTALVQYQGGPCAVIAPIQAFILKNMLAEEPLPENWRQVSPRESYRLLIHAVCDILRQAVPERGGTFIVAYKVSSFVCVSHPLSHSASRIDNFHVLLRLAVFDNVQQVEEFFTERIEDLQDVYGVLLVLYSVILTKGVENILVDINDTNDPLIDGIQGYGSQSLINLMLTGQAVAHVWDYEKNVDGLKLLGITKQSQIGFLSLLERMRYCQVGSHLKNPKYPIWVLGSETHLTVLFSTDKRLARLQTERDIASQVFHMYDPEGNNFIPSDKLNELLNHLGLVNDPEYVEFMKEKLDPENLGVILMHKFLNEFYPEENAPPPDIFTVFHYNGLPRAGRNGKVTYVEGRAILLECDKESIAEGNNIQTCLQTKWTSIDIEWLDSTPSLN